MSPVARLALLLVAFSTASGDIPRVEGVHEWYGARYCEISYRTSSPCDTRAALLDGDRECLLRTPETGAVLDHKLLAPLLAGRELSYSLLLPDGSRTEPRKLRRAAEEASKVKVWQEPGPAGGVDLVCSSGADAGWSLALGRSWERQVLDGGPGRSQSARFHLPKLGGAADRIEVATVTAKMLDSTEAIEAGPILGDRKLGPAFVEALDRLGLESLTKTAGARDTTEQSLKKAYEQRSSESGLAPLADAAARRALSILTMPTLDASTVRVPFSHGLNRLRGIDWVAHLRGWKPVTGIDEAAQTSVQLTQATDPGPASHALFTVNLKRPVGLYLWPGEIGGGVASTTYARLVDPKHFDEIAQTVLAETDPISMAMIGAGKYQLALWSQFDVEPSWIASPFVTLYVQIANLDPAFRLNVLLNDEVMLPARVEPSVSKGVLVFGQGTDDLARTLPEYGNWVAVRTSGKFFRGGKNSFVITAENLRPTKVGALGLLLGALRLGPG